MKFGLTFMNLGECSYPLTAARIATLAEALGFDSLWVVEHVVLPDPRRPPSPLVPHTRILDPLVALTYLATQTSQILLGTGIIILPQRNPLVLAKQLASLDIISDGRLIFGLGVGYLEPEFRALGIPFANRGARVEEYLSAIQTIWNEEHPAYHGQYVSFADIQAQPQPQRRVPIVIGGESPAVYRRVIERANGWYGFGLDLDGAAHAIAELHKAAQRYSRPLALGELEISITPTGPLNRETVARFADLGVHRLILCPSARRQRDLPYEETNETAITEFVTRVGETLVRPKHRIF